MDNKQKTFEFPVTDREGVERAVHRLYDLAGFPAPDVMFFGNYRDAYYTAVMVDALETQDTGILESISIIRDSYSDSFLHMGYGRFKYYTVYGEHIRIHGYFDDEVLDHIFRHTNRYNRNTLDKYSIVVGIAKLQQGFHASLSRFRFYDLSLIDKNLNEISRIKTYLKKMAFEVIFFRNTVVVAENPIRCYVDDDQLRLHRSERFKSSIIFKESEIFTDTPKIIFWKGRHLTNRIVHARAPTLTNFLLANQLAENDFEIQAIVEYHGGFATFLRNSENDALEYSHRNFRCVVVDREPDPEHGELIEVDHINLMDPIRFLRATCPRNGTICERVPSTINTTREAQAWRVGLSASEFEYPTKRT